MTRNRGSARRISLSVVLLIGALAGRSYAGATLTGETGLVMIPTTEVLAPGHLRAGIYGNGEIETDLTADDRDFDRVDFSLGVGLIEDLEFYSHIPVVFFSRPTPGFDDATNNGGLRLGLKYRLLDESNGAPVSAAVLADVVVGIGSNSLPAMLDRTMAFGRRETFEVMGIVDRTLWTTRSGERGVLTVNAGGLFFDKPKHYSINNQGTEFRRRFTGPDTTFAAPFEFAVGLNAPLVVHKDHGRLSWTEEYRGNTGTVDELRGSIPMQLFSGFRWTLPEKTGLALQGGIDIALSGVLDQYRYLAGLTWQTPVPPPAPAVVAQVPPPPPPPVPAPAKMKAKIVLRGVRFDSGKADIRSDAVPVLEEAAATLRDNPDLAVVVAGHTDANGSAAANDQLSLRRATAVRDYLVKLGVPAQRLTARGKGENEPVASNESDTGRAENRRVELLAQ
ncbi:MAG: OmpA family protein [Deltaproteobacteria bacterium]|nr:OmpA family protein [Deltaproteobacteria bacterium]